MLIFAQVHLASLPLWKDCSEHINISEAKGTSGHAVPVCMRTGDGSGWQSVTQTPPLLKTPPVCSLYLNPLFPFFSVAFWPEAALWSGGGGHGQDSWGQQEPCPNQMPSCFFHPMTPASSLNFCHLLRQGIPPETSTAYPTMSHIKTRDYIDNLSSHLRRLHLNITDYKPHLPMILTLMLFGC